MGKGLMMLVKIETREFQLEGLLRNSSIGI
jgi:hypothetical protein